MVIKILHQYHANMYDTYRALAQVAQVEFLSHRVSKLVPGIRNQVPPTLGRPAILYRPVALWRLLEQTNYVLLKHINNPLNIVPLLLAPLRQTQVVLVVQRVRHRSFRGYFLLLRLVRWWLRVINARIITVTRESFDELAPVFKRTTYLPVAVDVTRFPQAQLIPGDALRLLTVGKWQRRKHLDVAVHALALLIKRYPALRFRLTIIAAPTSEPASVGEKDRIIRLIKSLALTSSIELLDYVPVEHMPQQYRQAHLFILPARDEPLGYAVVEAMAAGLPVIVSEDTGAASYVRLAQNGWLVPPGDAEAIAACIAQHCMHKRQIDWPALASYGQASRQLAAADHAPAHWVALFKS